MQVQALRAIEPHLNLEKLYILGTNCVDNGPRHGLQQFLDAASSSPETVLHYEFMQVGWAGACLKFKACMVTRDSYASNASFGATKALLLMLLHWHLDDSSTLTLAYA